MGKFADKIGKTANKAADAVDSIPTSDQQQQQQQDSDNDLIGGAADKTFGTGNKKKK